ncbi:hypothetical protein GCM10027203_75770 [Nonomuraea fastidiosa]
MVGGALRAGVQALAAGPGDLAGRAGERADAVAYGALVAGEVDGGQVAEAGLIVRESTAGEQPA